MDENNPQHNQELNDYSEPVKYAEQNTGVNTATVKEKPKGKSLDFLDIIFRVGLGLLLFTNGIVAFVDPDSFKSLLETNIVGGELPSSLLDIMVVFAGINDLILAFLVLSGLWKKYVYAWIGLWFAVIAGVKLTNLIF